MKKDKLTVLAYYLPQFHTIPENDEWWGDGFTEWTTFDDLAFKLSPEKIRQPVGPYYNYTLPNKSVMEWQQDIAEEYGIDGFILWDYWFGNEKRLLQKPIEYATSKNIKFKFCVMWANHSWYNKTTNTLLMKQEYLGAEDYKKYFYELLPSFVNKNYIRIDDRLVFGIYLPLDIPDLNIFVETFNNLAEENNLGGFYFIAENIPFGHPSASLFEKIINTSDYFSVKNKLGSVSGMFNLLKELAIRKRNMNYLGPIRYSYEKLIADQNFSHITNNKYAPTIFTGWNTIPRHKIRGTVLTGFDEKSFKKHVRSILNYLKHKDSAHHQLCVIKSWNEWAEGNTFEPDSVFGYDLLKIFLEELNRY